MSSIRRLILLEPTTVIDGTSTVCIQNPSTYMTVATYLAWRGLTWPKYLADPTLCESELAFCCMEMNRQVRKLKHDRNVSFLFPLPVLDKYFQDAHGQASALSDKDAVDATKK